MTWQDEAWPPQMNTHRLTVSDVERLAKAGVKVEFKDIAQQVTSDPPIETTPHYCLPLVDIFWERWRRANPYNPNRLDMGPPWGIYASEFGDKVYLYVHPHDSEPFILEDDKHLYPSDALMAKLHLREKTK